VKAVTQAPISTPVLERVKQIASVWRRPVHSFPLANGAAEGGCQSLARKFMLQSGIAESSSTALAHFFQKRAVLERVCQANWLMECQSVSHTILVPPRFPDCPSSTPNRRLPAVNDLDFRFNSATTSDAKIDQH
jgi:hypothetical protein